MRKFVLIASLVTLCSGTAFANVDNYYYTSEYNYTENIDPNNPGNTYTDESFQVVYNDIPVQSYLAYPDDQNFIPESEFMGIDDNFDYDENIYNVRSEEYDEHPGVSFTEKPTVICRNFGCTKLNDRITRTFLFNSLSNMFMTNAHSRLYICEADPFSRSCLQSGISFPVRSGIANAIVKIPKASISQVNLSTGLSRATLGITYEILVNGIDRICEPTVMDITVPNNSQAVLLNREFSCNMTSDGMSNLSLMFNIDYIDLDYGLLGGYYSLGMQGPTTGSGTGYALFKTEFTSKGMKYNMGNSSNKKDKSLNGIIRPGEYSVDALKN